MASTRHGNDAPTRNSTYNGGDGPGHNTSDSFPIDADSNEQDTLLPQQDPSHASVYDPGPAAPSLLLLVSPALIAGTIVKAFDIAFLATTYTHIASELQHFTDGKWILFAASICSAVCVPLYSCLLKSFGIRRMVIVAYSAYAIGSGLCGLSSSFWQLLCSRIVLGFGSSGITLLTLVIINETVGMKQLPIWESLMTAVEMGTGIAAGPIGASMYRQVGWHSIFFLQFVLMLGALGLLVFCFARAKSYPQYSNSVLLAKVSSELPGIDVVGWALLAIAVTVPLVAFTLGDNRLSWSHPVEISLLVAGPFFIFAFVSFEAKVPSVPYVNMTPIFSIEYLKVLLLEFSEMFILNAIVYTIPPYIQARAIEGSTFADWALSSLFLGYSTGAFVGGYLIKDGYFTVRRIMQANVIILLVFCILFVSRAIKPEFASYAPGIVGFGIFTGIWQSCLLYITLSSTQKQWWAQNLALYHLIDMFGGDLGMILMSAITRSVAKSGIRSALGRSDATEKIIRDALRDLGSIRKLDPTVRAKVATAFENGMHSAFSMAIVVILLVAMMGPGVPQASYEESQSSD